MSEERREPEPKSPPKRKTTKIKFKRSDSGRNRRPPLNKSKEE